VNFTEKLRTELQKPLPGIETQLEMASGNRLFYKEFQNTEPPQNGSVLIVLYPFKSKWNTVFIKRTNDNGPHSGQMAFPGGMYEKNDETLYATALREANEEIGINKNQVNFVGKLTPLHIPVSNILVHPFIVTLPEKPILTPNKKEVDDILETPIDIFFDTKNHLPFTFKYKEKTFISSCFLIENYKIWGATAMIWNEFLSICKRL